jgi:translocation and assembly module TamB
MRRRIAGWSLGLFGTLGLALLLLFYTPPGLLLVGRLIGLFSGGQVQVDGLGGLFPNRLHAQRLEISDRSGIWLKVEQISLTWSALAMLRNHASIDSVSASRMTVLRRPIPSAASGRRTPRVDIEHLSTPQIVLAPPVIGHAVTLSAAGSLHYVSVHQLKADLLVIRIGSADRYRIAGEIASDVVRGTATFSEGADGILGKLVRLPGLGPVNLSAQATGDATANAVTFRLSAGPMHANGHGTLALKTRRADLDMDLAAPAMKLRPDIAWQAVSGEAHVHGSFDAPLVNMHLVIVTGIFQHLAARTLTLDARGNAGQVELDGVADRITLPGRRPALLAGAPVRLEAQLDLRDKLRPVRFTMTHPLAQFRGIAQTRGPLNVSADLVLPSLAPFGPLAYGTLDGSAALHLSLTKNTRMEIAVTGQVNTVGASVPARLLGKAALDLTATVDGNNLVASRLRLRGATLSTEMAGTLRNEKLNYRVALELKDLSRLAATVQGSLTLNGTATGPLQDAALSAGGSAILATRGFARQRVNIDLKANGLPSLRDARLSLDGRLDNAPVLLRATLSGGRPRQTQLIARWLSFSANAGITMGADGALTGKAQLALGKLTDINAFTGVPLSGAANATINFRAHGGRTDAAIVAALTGVRTLQATIGTVSASGNVSDITGKPDVGLAIGMHHLVAQGWNGDAEARLRGPLDRVAMTGELNLKDPSGSPLKAHAAASLNLTHDQMSLIAMEAGWHGLTLKLDSPAELRFAQGLTVDHLEAHLGKGRIRAAGVISPNLALTVSAAEIALADFSSFFPHLGAQGTFSGNAELQGTFAEPTGHISLLGSGLRTAYSSGAIPPATIKLGLQLDRDHGALDASVDAGANVHLSLTGTAPLKADGALRLHTTSKADLAVLDAFLAITGRRARGILTLEGDFSGTLNAPRISGRGSLTGGEFQDFAQSLRVNDIVANFVSDGTRFNLENFTGKAGQGQLSASGSIDLLAKDMPINMRVEANQAKPIASDLITASFSGAVTVTGFVQTSVTVGGNLEVTSGTINLPQNFPPEVAVLNVRRHGQPPPPPLARHDRILLSMTIRTAGPIFVRGHGVDATMNGSIQVSGNASVPVVAGEFKMDRGTFSFAGQTLDFTSGTVRFDGTSLRNRLDPALNFTAQTVSGGVTATLTITGYASEPKIVLSSTPQLPQDEVIAHLLFQQNVSQLTPLQMASIAQGAAAMGGIGQNFNPLSVVRRTLGLDRLAIGSVAAGANGTQSQTTVEMGRYVTRNVYVGVKQNIAGGTQTQVQVDITRQLKAQATLSTIASAVTPQSNVLQDNGSSIGLSYQFEY